jgi:ABC-2 type transport system ATP-binding protein
VSVIETAGLVKDYPRVRALDGLTFAMEGGGRAVGLLGPNGAGKSTLIKILLGFVPPTAGTVRVLGLDPARDALRIRQGIGYMPEVESYIPGLSGVDTVYLAARLKGLPHTDAMQRAHRVLNYVGLHEERYRRGETYSTGMKQKVKFAQAIVHHPKLLLLDEPTTGLDPRAREEMLQLIGDVSRGKGIDVVLSTHILHDVEVVCEKVVILHQGRAVAQDAIERLVAATRGSYDLRLKGDREAFLRAIRARGLAAAPLEGDLLRVASGDGTEAILRAAAESGVQLRHLAPAQESLEELFARLVEKG